ICYFSAGSYEDWRPDAKKFHKKDLGAPLEGWQGESWLNVRSANVHNIMKARLDLAVKKGCNAVDPDNVDGYNNNNGLNLTKKDAINYVNFLAKEAHKRKLAIGLKNAGEIVAKMVDVMDFSVNEQCEQYNECKTFSPFIKKNKPVFHV
ncbi:family 114 glycoside hydrolase, partial [Meira miltonrushii]